MGEPSIGVISSDSSMLKLSDVGVSPSSIGSSSGCQSRKFIIRKAKTLPDVFPSWEKFPAQKHFPGSSRHSANVRRLLAQNCLGL